MDKIAPNDICDYLSFRVSPDYKLVRFKDCLFAEARNELGLTFLFDESIKGKIDALKPRLEQQFKESVDEPDIKYNFAYQSSYMDDERLELVVRTFFKDNFSIMTLDLGDEDIKVTAADRAFNIEVHLPKHTADYVGASRALEGFLKNLREQYFYGITFQVIPKDTGDDATIEDIEAYVRENMKSVEVNRADKVRKISGMEYLLGKPIKERPVKIEYLRTSPDEQVIAGTINFLTRREYTKKSTNNNEQATNNDEKKPYWTFVLNDGAKKQNCIFFPNVKTLAKFEKLVNDTAVCLIGINDERNGRVSFNVKGVSFCELV